MVYLAKMYEEIVLELFLPTLLGQLLSNPNNVNNVKKLYIFSFHQIWILNLLT